MNGYILKTIVFFIFIFKSLLSFSNCPIPSPQYVDCTQLPADAIQLFSNYNGGPLISGRVYYVTTNSTANFPSNLNINGATILICGTGTVTAGNINFNFGSIVVSKTSRLVFENSLHVNNSSTIHNLGSLVVKGSLNAQSTFLGSNGFFNHEGAITTAQNFEINAAITNRGSIQVNENTNINGSGSICMGNGSDWSTANLQNNKKGAYSVPFGNACLRVSNRLSGNNSISTTEKLLFCKPNSLNAPANLVGAATIKNNCTDCMVPLSTELVKSSILNDNNKVILKWEVVSYFTANEFIVEHASGDGLFEEIGRITLITDKSDLSYSFIHEGFDSGKNFYRISYLGLSNEIYTMQTLMIDIAELKNVKLIPNPARAGEEVLVQLPGQNVAGGEVKLYDVMGHLIREEKSEAQTVRLNDLNSGNYIVQYTDLDGHIAHAKLIVR